MELLPEQRARYWPRIGAIALGLVLAVFASVVLSFIGFVAINWNGGASSESENLSPAEKMKLIESTLTSFPFLAQISAEENLQIKSVTPWAFTGLYGYYFVAYSVDLDRVPSVVAGWRGREDVVDVDVGSIDQSSASPPPWWPVDDGANILGVARLGPQAPDVNYVHVWCEPSNGMFYVFFSWGH